MLKYKYLNWVGKSCLYQILKRFEIVDHYCDVSHNLSKGLVELSTIIIIIHTILAYAGEQCPLHARWQSLQDLTKSLGQRCSIESSTKMMSLDF